MMKILFLADMPPDPNLGAAGTEYQTIEALRSFGLHVDAIWDDDLPHKIKHGNLHYLLELPYAYRNRMLTKLNREAYDVIHVNQPHGYLAAKALSKLKLRTVFIHRSHGFEARAEHDLSPWKNTYHTDGRSYLRRLGSKTLTSALSYNGRRVCQYADGHIVYAQQCGDYLHEQMGVPKERIAVIPAAAPPEFLERPLSAMTEKRLRRILYVGQFAFFKAPMILAETINRLAENNVDLTFTWVCAKEHHSEVAQLLCERVRERVDLLGWMPQDELVQVYDEHGIFLFPSFFEGFGKVFLEAMSRGLCVAAADNGGARDVISHGQNGMLNPTGSVDSMVDNCLRLLNSPDLAFAMSKLAVESSRAYTWQRVASETARFYQDRLAAKLKALNVSDGAYPQTVQV